MKRIPFSQVLTNVEIDPRREYGRLYSMFFIQKTQDGRAVISIEYFCSMQFIHLPFRGTCISLKDFNNEHGYNFTKEPSDFDIDYLISFCEYTHNLVVFSAPYAHEIAMSNMLQSMQIFIQQIERVIELIGYMPNEQKNGIIDYVPKDQAAISVAEIIDPDLSYKVIEYNHHSMKGDFSRKRDTILALADKLEPQRAELKKANSSLETDLFFLLNNINLRHNNNDPNGKNYKAYIAGMKQENLEEWYDDTYQMCLLAFLELDNEERKDRVKQLKQDIQNC